MRYLLAAVAGGLVAFAATAADEKKEPAKSVVREIDLTDVKVAAKEDAAVGAPTVIKGEEELKKAVGEEAAKAMKVDFKKEYLALFQWAGSGQDKLTHAEETKDGKTTVTTTYTPGRTKDLRQHARLIALPVGAEWKMAK